MAAENPYKIQYLHDRLINSKGHEHNLLFLVREVENHLEWMSNSYAHSKRITKSLYILMQHHTKLFLESIQISTSRKQADYYTTKLDSRIFKEIRILSDNLQSPYLPKDLDDLYELLEDYKEKQKQKRNQPQHMYKKRKLYEQEMPDNDISNYNPNDWRTNQEIQRMKSELKGKELYKDIVYKGSNNKIELDKEIVDSIEEEEEEIWKDIIKSME